MQKHEYKGVWLGMEKCKELIRLLEQGISQSQISRSLGISRQTVRDYKTKLKLSGLSYKEISGYSSQQLTEAFSKRKSGKPAKEIDFSKISVELKRKGMTRYLLWEEYIEANGEEFSYSQFCSRLASWQKSQKIYARRNYAPGERAEVDFSGLTVAIYSAEGKVLFKAEIFVGCLFASNYTFAYAVKDQKLASWIKANTQMLNYFTGVPKTLVPDNLKSAVTTFDRNNPKINQTFSDFANYYQTLIDPARPGKPQDKGKVEKAVQVVQTRILAKIRNIRFTSLGELNQKIAELLEDLNSKPMQAYNKSRKELFIELEQAKLTKLPREPYQLFDYKRLKITPDYHILLNGKRYSVPYKYRGSRCTVRYNTQIIEVLVDGTSIARHLINEHDTNHCITLPEHLAPQHQDLHTPRTKALLTVTEGNGESSQVLLEEKPATPLKHDNLRGAAAFN